MSRLRTNRSLLVCILVFTVCGWGAADVFAQRSEAGGGFRARGGVLGLLGSAAVQRELGLSEEQIGQLGELRDSARPGADVFDPLFEKLGRAQSDAERDAVRAEMLAVTEKFRVEAEAKLSGILSEPQRTTLAGEVIARAGVEALNVPFVREQLGISVEQARELEAAAGSRESGDESKTALAVLTDEQRATWDLLAKEASEGEVAETGQGETETEEDRPVSSYGAEEIEGDREAEARTISFNFQQAPWSEVLRQFADFANLTLDLNDVPPGTFSYLDNRKYTPTEALDVLNGYLLRKGYILVRRDRFLICLNIDNGIPPNLVPNITVEELAERGGNELLNVVFPIEGVPAAEVAQEVELLLGPQGRVVPLTTSNSLVVTDIGSNLRRIERLLATVSQAGLGDMVFKAYPLTHLDPGDAESIVKAQLGLNAGIRSVSSAYEDWRRDRDRDRDDDRDRNERRPATGTDSKQPRVASDMRTKSLLVTANSEQHRIVEETLKATDVAVTNGGFEPRRDNEPYLEVYTLYESDPQEVVKTLDVLMPGVVVNEDGRNEKIHVHAPRAVQEEVQRLIRQLDADEGRNQMAVTVIPLASMDPYAAATSIQSLFLMEDDDDMPIIEADTAGRRLLVRGTQEQVTQVKSLLAEMGEDGTGVASGLASGPVRTIPLGGRDPEELVPILQRLWETSSDVPIRVVPSSPSMIIEKRPLGTTAEEGDPVTSANFMVTDDVPVAVEPVEAEKGEGQGGTGRGGEEPLENAESGADEPVVVTVQGGNLVLSSEDEAALDRIQELVARLGEVIPARTKWSVFYLRSADATETAMLLEQIFPTSDVATAAVAGGGLLGSFSRGFSSFGGGLMDATGLGGMGLNTQELRIVPDIRSNSLFVTGPPNKVAEVEQVLKVLDTTDLPDSLRERLPRMIDVEYADVNEVAEIVRNVYKDYLEPMNTGGRMANNPLAMLMGGGRGRDRDDDEPQGAIRLTVGVDEATSKLIVSADEALFLEIKELVASLDQAQLEAKRTVRVVTLQNADAAAVTTTLGSLIPKVRTSSTSDRRDSSNRDSDRNDSSSSWRDDDDRSDEERRERIRRYMEYRARMGDGDRNRDDGDRDRRRGRD